MFHDLEQLVDTFKFGNHQSINLYKACNMMINMKECKIFLGCTAQILNSETYKMIYQLIKKRLVDVLVINADFLVFDILNGKDNNTSKDISSFCISIQRDLSKKNFVTSDLVREIGTFLGQSTISGMAAIQNINIYIPDFCDSLFGIYLKDLIIDPLGDCKKLNEECFFIEKTAAVILGTSNIKHAILNANLFKGGLDQCVIVNSCNEMDCSDSGANVDEAVSWGKIVPFSGSVKVKGDPCIIFPILWHYWMKIGNK